MILRTSIPPTLAAGVSVSPHVRGCGGAVRTVETMTFREFCTTSSDDPGPRRATFARVNASLAGLIVATGGVAVARLVDGSLIATMVLAPIVGVAGVAAMLGLSYTVFRRGEPEK